jgi:hypothetical protein
VGVPQRLPLQAPGNHFVYIPGRICTFKKLIILYQKMTGEHLADMRG